MIAEVPQWTGWLLWPTVLTVSMTLDALYCGMETGVYVINKIRLDLHAEGGHRSASYLQRMLRDPRRMLAVLLIGTNIARYVSTFAITAMFLMAGAGERAEFYTVAVATPLLFVVGDALPKSVFQRLGERPVYAFTWLLRASAVVFRVTLLSPLVVAVATMLMWLTGRRDRGAPMGHEGLHIALAEGHASGAITHFQSVMADRVMNISEVRLLDVMTPMRRVVKAPVTVEREELLELYRRHSVSRIVLTDESGQVTGLLNFYDALTAEAGQPPACGMTSPLVLPESLPVAEALVRMQTRHAVMAIVEHADGRHVGIITIKDLVEEIVGEIEAW